MTSDSAEKVSLERRAEEHLRQLSNHIGASQQKCKYELESAQVIEQLLSENRQISAENEDWKRQAQEGWENERIANLYYTEFARMTEMLEEANAPTHKGATPATWAGRLSLLIEAYSSAQATITSLRQDLDRISAERESYREALAEIERWADGSDYAPLQRIRDIARRILAENDR